MQAPKTHFEQIPVELVKEIAKELWENDPVDHESKTVRTPPDGDGQPQERWREVAQRVQEEQDPTKMIGLVQQLIVAIDKEQHRKP